MSDSITSSSFMQGLHMNTQKSMSVYARFTYTVQRHLEGSILLKWVIWHVTFFFASRAQDYTFCLLIVRFMLSDKIEGKSALKARTFLHERDKKKLCIMLLV